jgi:hypothetical protein
MSPRQYVAGLAVLLLCAADAMASGDRGCFAGRDASGGPALMTLVSERYGNYFELRGHVRTSRAGVLQIKVDGWSGAGRMFRSQEFEGGALYVRLEGNANALVLHVEGDGSFPFRRIAC